MSGPNKPEWDTPPHGDFASYVERLNAQGAAPRPAAPPSPGMDKTVPKGRVAANAPVLPPDLAQVLAPLVGVLGTVRMVLLVATAVHAIAFFGFGRGALPGLLFMGILWWGLGRVAALASGALPSGGAGSIKPGLASLQERLAQLAKQGTTGKRK